MFCVLEVATYSPLFTRPDDLIRVCLSPAFSPVLDSMSRRSSVLLSAAASSSTFHFIDGSSFFLVSSFLRRSWRDWWSWVVDLACERSAWAGPPWESDSGPPALLELDWSNVVGLLVRPRSDSLNTSSTTSTSAATTLQWSIWGPLIIIIFVYLIDDKLHYQHQHPPRRAGHNRHYIQKG